MLNKLIAAFRKIFPSHEDKMKAAVDWKEAPKRNQALSKLR